MIVDKLKKIVTTLGGSFTAKDDTVSELLEQINTAFENGGGGGGSGLPAVTTDDNGKLLGVTGGAWGKVDAPTETVFVPFAVTVGDGGGFVASTTAAFADVKAAVVAGKNVVADVSIVGGSKAIAPIVAYNPSADPSVLVFSTLYRGSGSTDKATMYQIGFSSDAVSFEAVELT